MICILLSVIEYLEELSSNPIINSYIKSDMKVVCIPFASDIEWLLKNDYGEFAEKHYLPFSKFGIPKENFHVLKITDREDENKLHLYEADVIYFSGGRMEKIDRLLYFAGLKDYLIELKYNKIFIGESAGALYLQDSYMEVPYIEDQYTKYKRVRKGLDIIKEYDVLVHYDKYNKKHKRNLSIVKLLDMRNHKTVIGLSDKSALVVEYDKCGSKNTYLFGDYTK